MNIIARRLSRFGFSLALYWAAWLAWHAHLVAWDTAQQSAALGSLFGGTAAMTFNVMRSWSHGFVIICVFALVAASLLLVDALGFNDSPRSKLIETRNETQDLR